MADGDESAHRRREFQQADPAIRDVMLLEVCAFISSDVEKALEDLFGMPPSPSREGISRHLRQVHARAALLGVLAGAPPATFILPAPTRFEDAGDEPPRQPRTHRSRPRRTPASGESAVERPG